MPGSAKSNTQAKKQLLPKVVQSRATQQDLFVVHKARILDLHNTKLEKIIWVLAPEIQTTDANLEYYYDFHQSIKEYKRVFKVLDLKWKWQFVTCGNYKDIIDSIFNNSIGIQPVFFNICDGDDINGIPGISVVKYLKLKGLIYTGADDFFYEATTSKITMKKLFDCHDVATPKWKIIKDRFEDVFNELATPVIVKPAVSAGSMGVGISSVVHNPAELQAQVLKLHSGYRGWELSGGGIIAEEFIKGREFTSFIIGDYTNPEMCKVYPAVERVFHKDLPDEQKFLSFDRLWEIYEEEQPIHNGEDLYTYQKPDLSISHQIDKISLDAYVAVKGMGYGRVDLRVDEHTKKLYVLEVNAQCGLSKDENFTSIGAILRLSGKTFPDLIRHIIDNALNRAFAL